jgi:toxin ParE1/3/4
VTTLDWSPSARDDLLHIRTYIATHRPAAARRIGARIVQTARRLVAMPKLGPPGREPGTREIVVTGTPYLVVYRLDSGGILILRVLHGRQRWPAMAP